MLVQDKVENQILVANHEQILNYENSIFEKNVTNKLLPSSS